MKITINLMVTLKLMVIEMTVLLSKLIVDGYCELDGNQDDSWTIKDYGRELPSSGQIYYQRMVLP
jgi:hypothetical protein